MLGLIVNPVAGIGGPAGLAGSDGADVQRAALGRHSAPRAAARASLALGVLDAGTTILTAAGAMGEVAAREAGLQPEIVFEPGDPTTPGDTRAAARMIVEAGATLVLFAGGDGTARDVASGLEGRGTAALGIPAGVKMYSPVFAVSPRAAGAIAARWLAVGLPVHQREVLDIDEAAMRRARVEPRLHGMLTVPYRTGRTQSRKSPTPVDERDAVTAAARGAAALLRPGVRYLLGPGGTMGELARALGVEKTPLGVDVVLDGRVICAGASERQLLGEVSRGPARAVITVIGGQGFLLGRGNQQLSAPVLRALGGGPDGAGPLLVVAPESKLIELHGRALLVDTGDPEVDARFAGFISVVTGSGASSIYPVHAPELQEENHAS